MIVNIYFKGGGHRVVEAYELTCDKAYVTVFKKEGLGKMSQFYKDLIASYEVFDHGQLILKREFT